MTSTEFRESTRRSRIGDDAEGWLSSLERLLPIPPMYRREDLDRRGAVKMLRCGDDLLTELIERGLPCTGEPGAELFDRNDLFNLALYSGSRKSEPEMAFQFALRWMRHPSEAWLRPRRWHMSVELRCARSAGCGAEPRWAIARPRPELFGGKLLSLTAQPPAAAAGAGTLEATGEQGLGLSSVIETRGAREEVRSPRLKELVGDFMRSGYRWMKLPEELQRHPDLLLPHGVATCIAASCHLEREFRAAGFQARSRRGWVLGMLDLAHAWVEVEDDDGRTKVVDPIFALLSLHASNPNPEFAQACLGSRMNRLVPSEQRADEPLAWHACDGGAAPVERMTDTRPLRGEQGGEA